MQLRVLLFLRVGGEVADIFVDRARDHVEIEPLRLFRALIHIKREALGARVAQPLLDGQPVAARLRNLLALLVEKELVVEAFRLLRPEDAADLA